MLTSSTASLASGGCNRLSHTNYPSHPQSSSTAGCSLEKMHKDKSESESESEGAKNNRKQKNKKDLIKKFLKKKVRQQNFGKAASAFTPDSKCKIASNLAGHPPLGKKKKISFFFTALVLLNPFLLPAISCFKFLLFF